MRYQSIMSNDRICRFRYLQIRNFFNKGEFPISVLVELVNSGLIKLTRLGTTSKKYYKNGSNR